MMKMFFHFGIKETILFESWLPATEFQLTISCFLLLALTIILEAIKTYRLTLQQSCSSACLPTLNVNGAPQSDQEALILGWSKKGRNHVLDAMLYGIQLTISYCLMLAVMTFNIWIFIPVIIGAIIGYFLFGENTLAQDRTKDAHCN